MKTILASFFLLAAMNALATSDGLVKTAIVTYDGNSEEYAVEKVPVIGCFGPARGADLIQFTAEYKVTANIGCGGTPTKENINALTCAKVVKEVESRDYTTFSEITLDISKCAAKTDQKFIAAIKTAANINFSTPKNKLKLTLLK